MRDFLSFGITLNHFFRSSAKISLGMVSGTPSVETFSTIFLLISSSFRSLNISDKEGNVSSTPE
ncbi:hypothetical protein HanXRQr2_Chr15g0700461 [Helianthus annuus]|uniref:Uncharacterized protein n=1 Tax=Helianthus annuus TaxID=4232 RepID=A0A9K3E301_HELAN|nr:hypothetical protein HanXRQr2_Chr15g0700461 [Helianthus annuus]KAJ0831869.1 hypothetical protein HanPSC8_Chr15g0672131 [Helianthus annuus]